MLAVSPNKEKRTMIKQLENTTKPEPFYSIPKTCELLGLKQHALRRAVNSGLVPHYCPFGTRKYVRLSEVTVAIETFQHQGGLK